MHFRGDRSNDDGVGWCLGLKSLERFSMYYIFEFLNLGKILPIISSYRPSRKPCRCPPQAVPISLQLTSFSSQAIPTRHIYSRPYREANTLKCRSNIRRAALCSHHFPFFFFLHSYRRLSFYRIHLGISTIYDMCFPFA